MPHNWWTRKSLVLAAAAVALASAIGFFATGVSYPEPVARATLGRIGSAAGWHSSSRPAAGRSTPRPCPCAWPRTRCARGCGRNRIRPQRAWLELEHFMQRRSCLVVAASVAALISLPAGVALAQSAPNTGTGTTTAAPSATAAETAPATAEKEKPAPEKEAGQDDPAAGDRSVDRSRHGARALPQFGAERIPAIYSVR